MQSPAAVLAFPFQSGVCRRGYCSGSPVTSEGFCVEHQDEVDEGRRRAALMKNPRPKRTQHGSNAGYMAHRRAGTPPCAECRAAHSAYEMGHRNAE